MIDIFLGDWLSVEKSNKAKLSVLFHVLANGTCLNSFYGISSIQAKPWSNSKRLKWFRFYICLTHDTSLFVHVSIWKKCEKIPCFIYFAWKKLHLKSHSRRIGSNSLRLIIVVACITYLGQFCSKTNARFAHFDFDVQLIIAKFTVDFHLWGIAESCNGKCHFWGKSICTVFHKKFVLQAKCQSKGEEFYAPLGPQSWVLVEITQRVWMLKMNQTRMCGKGVANGLKYWKTNFPLHCHLVMV